MKPAALPNAIVVPIPNDLYNVEYDSKISGVNDRNVIRLKNLNETKPNNKYYALQYHIVETEIIEKMVPIKIIGIRPILSIKPTTMNTAGNSIRTV